MDDKKNETPDISVETNTMGDTQIKTNADSDKVTATVTTETSPVTPTAEPQVQTQTVVVEKKKNGWLMCCLIVFIILILCCGSLVALAVFAPNALIKNISSQTEKPNLSVYTQGSETEANLPSSNLETKFTAAETEATLKNSVSFTVNYTEQDLVNQFTRALDDKTVSNAFYLDINTERISFRIDGKVLVKLIKDNSKTESDNPLKDLDPSIADGLYVGVDLKPSADKTSVTVSKITTGNSFLDSYIPADATSNLEQELNRAIDNNSTDSLYKLNSIVLKDGSMDLTYVKQ